MISYIHRLRIKFLDNLRYSQVTHSIVFVKDLIAAKFSRNRLHLALGILKAYRRTFREFWINRLSNKLQHVREIPEEEVIRITRKVWSWTDSNKPLDRTILLKAPSPDGERGVILVFPEYNWLRLVTHSEAIRELGTRFDWILSAGWSPLDYSLLELVTRRIPGVIYIQPCNRQEIRKIESFHPNLKCLPTLGCDWINPDLYTPQPHQERKIDILMVANWGPFKRHWHLFSALNRMPPEIKVHLVGQSDGMHRRQRIENLARLYNVPQNITIHENLHVRDVQNYLMSARISIILSRHEGYCGAVTESLFANTPVGLLADAFIGSKEYINSLTGVLLPHNNIDKALIDFLRNSDEFQPRKWAVENISCYRSWDKVNSMLRKEAVLAGRPWTRNIAQFCWRPLARLIHNNEAEQLRPTARFLANRWPELFGLSLIETIEET